MSSAADSKRGMNVVTTAMAFSVSAFFVLFVFTRLLCARLHLSRAAAAADRTAGDAFVVNVERGIHELEPSVVTTFPTVKLGDGGGPQQLPPVPEESQSQCTVCLEEYEAKDVVRVLPACGHAFHAPCIDAWLRQHPTCPVCRASLRASKPSSGGNRAAPPVDYSVVLAASATATPAAREAPAASTTQLVPVPSSSDITAASSPQADGGHRTDTGADDHQLEIVTEEPASPGDRSPAAAPVGGGSHSPCGETAGQRGSGAGASEHC